MIRNKYPLVSVNIDRTEYCCSFLAFKSLHLDECLLKMSEGVEIGGMREVRSEQSSHRDGFVERRRITERNFNVVSFCGKWAVISSSRRGCWNLTNVFRKIQHFLNKWNDIDVIWIDIREVEKGYKLYSEWCFLWGLMDSSVGTPIHCIDWLHKQRWITSTSRGY